MKLEEVLTGIAVLGFEVDHEAFVDETMFMAVELSEGQLAGFQWQFRGRGNWGYRVVGVEGSEEGEHLVGIGSTDSYYLQMRIDLQKWRC